MEDEMNQRALPAATRLCTDIPVEASAPKIPPMQGEGAGPRTELPVPARAPKLPPLQGEGGGPRTIVPARAISHPKLPPFQGD
jgi:hypothetical protein